jgi:hypothetical protein
MYYSDYAAWLRDNHVLLAVEPGCNEIGPRYNPTQFPNSPPWNMDWVIYFPDKKHVYLYERWFPIGPLVAGRTKKGYRKHFSFHYGTTGPINPKTGFPLRDKDNHPAIIRIDSDAYGPHIHFHGELPHIPQSQVDGMLISDADPFEFVKHVLKHRKTGEDFDLLMNFTVSK